MVKKFSGEYDSSVNIRLWKVLQWKLFKAPLGSRTSSSLKTKNESAKLASKEDFVCWLSHASFLIQLGGKRIIIDPVFGDIPFYKRHTPFPYHLNKLMPLDYLLISHSHYDHFDTASLRQIAKHNPKAIVPQNMRKLLARKVKTLEGKELQWYESFEEDELKITLVPAKHWSRRGIFDKNTVLWGGYIIEYQNICIYFSGDTTIGEHFKEIGHKYAIDIAILPIGAYAPEFIMKYNHTNPQEAYEAYLALNAKVMIPMHYGTFKLSDEPMDEPLTWIKKIKEENTSNIQCTQPGEVLFLNTMIQK
jgi:L-ascorbate metabolism protein UlaG (beta-lactamase superfamily)